MASACKNHQRATYASFDLRLSRQFLVFDREKVHELLSTTFSKPTWLVKNGLSTTFDVSIRGLDKYASGGYIFSWKRLFRFVSGCLIGRYFLRVTHD
jgi:hypothetical protein